MSAAWPWVILGRIPRVTPIPSGAEAKEAAFQAADFSIRVAPPPEVAAVTVGPLAHPDPNEPDKYPYILAAGPDCLLLNFAVAPFYGVDSAVGAQDMSYLVVARGFRAPQQQGQGHAAAPVGEPIPGRDDVAMPAAAFKLMVRSVGLVASYDGHYTVAELVVYNGTDRASLLRFRDGGGEWTRTDLSFPLAAECRDWVPDGVVAQKETLWWFDLSWGLLSCDTSVDDPPLLFHELPEDRAWSVHMPVQPHTHRCVTVSHRELRYVEIIPEAAGGRGGGDGDKEAAATVSMWTRRIAAAPAGWEWEKNYAVSFEEIWNDDSYEDTGLPRKVPVLSAVCPSNPDLVYFSLEKRLFGVDVPKHMVVEVADEPHALVNCLSFSQTPASCRFVHAWNVPPQVAIDLGLVGFSSSDEDEDQAEAEELDEEELYKLGLEVAMGMDPSTLQSEVDKFVEGPKFPSPEREVMNQLRVRAPFNFWLTEKEAEADLRMVDRLMKKRRLGD
ncbi:unnamed protein product [Urochloa humidicola]